MIADGVEATEGDLLILQQLESMEVDLSQPLGVALFFYMPDLAAAKEMTRHLEEAGFAVEILESEDEFLTLAMSEVIVSSEIVSQWRLDLGQAAESLGGYYDGFEVGPLP